jgi:hypothetical protein
MKHEVLIWDSRAGIWTAKATFLIQIVIFKFSEKINAVFGAHWFLA